MYRTDPPASNALAIQGGTPARAAPIETTVEISDQARERVVGILETGRLSTYYSGPWALRLEQEYARYHGPGLAAVSVNSGTSALHLSITAACIGPGDEVIVPAFCFVAAVTSIVQNGGIPIICDAEPDSLTMDVGCVEQLITERTKAVLAVHFWGYPANSAALAALCEQYGLTYIEDGAQSLGGSIAGRKLGTFGRFGTCSFSTRKHVNCGEGGMVLCSETDQDHIRALSNYGKGPHWDDYESLGFSYRLNEISAVIALDGLSRLDNEVALRRQAGRLYADGLRGSGLEVVAEPLWGESVFFKCPIKLPEGCADQRSNIARAISAENVSCRAPHRPLFSIPWLAAYLKEVGSYRGPEDCPVAASVFPRLIEVETGPHLPPAEAEVTLEAVSKVWARI